MNYAILVMSAWVALWAAFASLASNRRKPQIRAVEMARQIAQDRHEVWHTRVEQAIRQAEMGYSTAVDIGAESPLVIAPKQPVLSWCAGCDELPDVQTMAFTDDGRWRCAAAGVLTPNEARA